MHSSCVSQWAHVILLAIANRRQAKANRRQAIANRKQISCLRSILAYRSATVVIVVKSLRKKVAFHWVLSVNIKFVKTKIIQWVKHLQYSKWRTQIALGEHLCIIMGKQLCEIFLDGQQNRYYAGQVITGHVKLTLRKIKKIRGKF